MKQLILLAGVIALLCSCASFPEPESQGDSLVIGSFVLDFPDGFFNQPPRKITSGVTLHMVNVTKNRNFTLMTMYPGYFYFLTNGSDEFKFDSWEFETEGYQLHRNPIKWRIIPAPDKVIYIGHSSIMYLKPKIKRAYGDQSSTWNFEHDFSFKWDKEATLQFIKKIAPESQWLSREVVEHKVETE
jgi:hypothetical protein